MRSPPLEKKRHMRLTDPAPPEGVHGLVRRLVKQLESGDAEAGLSVGAAGEDVLLDIHVDGVRCLLVRVLPRPARPAWVLSPREREIARMVARGYPNKTIAGVLEISSWTVGTYLRRIYAKLNIGSRAAMVARLMEVGLLKE
jgi:DNA-binding CsgD family transcriptional regulator